MLSMEIKGFANFEAALAAKIEDIRHAAEAASYIESEVIMAQSKSKFVPVATGALRSTGHVEAPKVEGPIITTTMGFGGPSADYALIVHEDLEAHHNVGEAKYLEKPAREEISSGAALDRMSKTIRAAIT